MCWIWKGGFAGKRLSRHGLLASSPFPSHFSFWTDCQKFFRNILSFITQDASDQDWTHFIKHNKKSFRKLFLSFYLATRVTHAMRFKKNNNCEVGRHIVMDILNLWYYRVYRNVHISTTTVPTATKLERVVDLPRGAPTHKVTWTFDHEIFEDNVTNWNHYISKVPIATDIGTIVIYLKELLAMKLNGPCHMTRGFRKSRDKLKPLHLH